MTEYESRGKHRGFFILKSVRPGISGVPTPAFFWEVAWSIDILSRVPHCSLLLGRAGLVRTLLLLPMNRVQAPPIQFEQVPGVFFRLGGGASALEPDTR